MTRKLSLTDILTSVPGIGPATFFKLQKKGIERVIDLLRVFPTRYEDYRTIVASKNVKTGEKITVIGTISNTILLLTKRRGLTITKATLYDLSGSIDLIWFNQPYLKNNLVEDTMYAVSGSCDFFAGKKVIKVTEYEEKTERLHHTGSIVPYYSEVFGVTQKFLRNKIHAILGLLASTELSEYLPLTANHTLQLLSPLEFFNAIHAPVDLGSIEMAHFRLAYEEILSSVLAQEKIKALLQKHKATPIPHSLHDQTFKSFIQKLPFILTNAQLKAIDDISENLSKRHPMNRLLLGDVGSGKTVVMAYAMLLVALAKKKSVVLVPTETLARQHVETFTKLLQPFNLTVGLSLGGKLKHDIQKCDVMVGTHALLYQTADWSDVSLVTIDEQHKFGVNQRNELIEKIKTDFSPHMLFVSATPIPRSLALTVFGSLDITYIDEMPHGRKLVRTYVVPEEKRQQAYVWISKTLRTTKSQMYVVCPLISTSTNERMVEKKSVVEELEHLKEIFPSLQIAGIHSKERDKESIFQQFKKGGVSVLVTTTVIEVGMDVPNASIMFIEDADRFGLAQLHQLRGRVGRSTQQSYCFLFSKSITPQAFARLKALETTNDGFKLAEIDLKLRGSGNVFGLSQHGFGPYVEKYLFDVALLGAIKDTAHELLALDPNFNYNSTIRNTALNTVSTDINLN